jgi:hypothetical protein
MICSKKSSHCETAGVASRAGVFVAGSRCVILLCQDTGEIVSAVFIAAIFVSTIHLQPLAGAFLCVCEACVLTGYTLPFATRDVLEEVKPSHACRLLHKRRCVESMRDLAR